MLPAFAPRRKRKQTSSVNVKGRAFLQPGVRS
jgi:hypothetical protein